MNNKNTTKLISTINIQYHKQSRGRRSHHSLHKNKTLTYTQNDSVRMKNNMEVQGEGMEVQGECVISLSGPQFDIPTEIIFVLLSMGHLYGLTFYHFKDGCFLHMHHHFFFYSAGPTFLLFACTFLYLYQFLKAVSSCTPAFFFLHPHKVAQRLNCSYIKLYIYFFYSGL